MTGRRVLLVEGASDVDFFRALLPDLALEEKVDVCPPRDFGRRNTVTVVPALLPELIGQLERGSIDRLAVVVDADYDSGGGFQTRWERITAILREQGYRCPQRPPTEANKGSIFLHSDGLPPVGLWLLPNHREDGMLEDLVLRSVHQSEKQGSLLTHARQVIEGLPHRLFSQHHHAKAVTYSWLSYQRRPAIGLSAPVREELLDRSTEPLRGLCDWLSRVFASG